MSRIAANRGFTLIEMLIVIAIVAILVRMAVPSLQGLMEGNAVNKHVTSFMSDLRYARSEALKSGQPVVMCRSANSETATPPTCTSGGWESGWLIFVDRDGTSSYSTGDTLLRVRGVFTDSGGITPTATMNAFVFRPTGLMSAGASTFNFNTLSLNGSRQKVVCISMQGRARLLPDSTTACSS